jgi:hypothetical protein
MTPPEPEPDSPIERYLDELVAGLSQASPRNLRYLLAEVEAHLREDAQAGTAVGRSTFEAETAAVRRFGPARDVAPPNTIVRRLHCGR